MSQKKSQPFIFAAGGSRGGERAVKDETKSSSSSLKSRDKGEEMMDWEADTKDVLEQLLRDDVTIICVNLVRKE